MSSRDVLSLPVAAQILGLIYEDLAVEQVSVDYYLPENADVDFSRGEALISMWEGEHVSARDAPLLTVFTFVWQGRQRQVIFYSWEITSDRWTSRDALPRDDLKELRAQGYEWAYLAADGLLFFSELADNGAQKANQQLLRLLAPDGLVILDYPTDPSYHRPSAFGGFIGMAGRARLERWGLKKILSMPLAKHVFGYSGLAAGDQVKIYQKQENTSPDRTNAKRVLFDFSRFIHIGPTYSFHLSRLGI